MTVAVRFRDAFRKYIPPWLSDRSTYGVGLSAGYRFLWTMIAPLDAAAEVLVQGLQAPWPGKGTPTALPLIGRTRGMIRGEAESDDDYAARLLTWLDRWRAAGSAEAIARAIQEYCANHPKVRIVTRSGYWVTLNTDGTITRTTAAWSWDGASHPERAGFWSEIWVIVYPTPYAHRATTLGTGTLGADTLGIGHLVPRTSYDAIKGLVSQWKSAHTKVRAIVWTSDATLFDPTNPGTLPDGNWGAWGTPGSGARVASSRNLSTCRYWELS